MSKAASVVSSYKNGGSVVRDGNLPSTAPSTRSNPPTNLVTIPKSTQKGKVLGDVEITEEELLHLAEVCKRCELLHQQEEERIRNIRVAALKTERNKSGVSVVDDEHCSLCGAAFYVYINPNRRCFQCDRNVCKACTKKTLDNDRTVCKTCFIECQNKAKTGLWFSEKLRQAKQEGRVDALAPTYALRQSLKRKKLEASAANSTVGTDLQNGNGVEEKTNGAHQNHISENDTSSAAQQLICKSLLQQHKASSYQKDEMARAVNFNSIFADLDNLPATLPRPSNRSTEQLGDNSNWDNKSMISAVSGTSMTSIYSEREDSFTHGLQITGDLCFSIDYDVKTSSLVIFIKQGREFAVADKKLGSSDTYVKTYLLPAKTKHSKRKTRVKKRTVNPIYNEQLTYEISKAELTYRTLQLSVWHHRHVASNLFLGEILVPLADYRFSSSPTWRALQPGGVGTSMYQLRLTEGSITLGLKYIPSAQSDSNGALEVFVKSAQKLNVPKGVNTLEAITTNPFVKLKLLPERAKEGKKKTKVVKKESNPVWDEKFTFENIAKTDLPSLGLEVLVMDHNHLGGGDFLGGCVLNSGANSGMRVIAVGEECRLWMEMINKTNVVVETTILLRSCMD